MKRLEEAYKGKTVVVTGHTGFKGSWLSYWLTKMGAHVYGVALPPVSSPNHYSILELQSKMHSLIDFDVKTEERFPCHADIVFHLAASAIVAKTFDDPKGTFYNNVMGAVNVMEMCRNNSPDTPLVMITTDKVYANKEWGWGYRENDELGGLDPYSASKVCVEHAIECYRTQFLPYIATARAGNVIGGGDWAYARLMPDIAKATAQGITVKIHTPHATRPWQHVLEPLYGYLLLGKHLMEGNTAAARNWNFGPTGEMTVVEVLEVANKVWTDVKFEVDDKETHPSMVILLKIDSTDAKHKLGWIPRWDMREAVARTMMWYKKYYTQGIVSTDADIEAYCNGGQ